MPRLLSHGSGGITTLGEQSVSRALKRLRFTITLCCGIVAGCLLIHWFVWSLVTFTDLRHLQLEDRSEAPLVITSDDQGRRALRSPAAVQKQREAEEAASAAVDPNVVFSTHDALFRRVVTLSSGGGRLAMTLLITLLGLTTLLTMNASVYGTHRTISALVWALLVAVFTLPAGTWFGLPWGDGALGSYQALVAPIDNARSDEGVATAFHLVHGALPLVCVVTVVLIAWEVRGAVATGIIANEDMRLDPELEMEARNVSPTSLHAGRSAGALHHVLNPERRTTPADEPERRPLPSATQVSPGVPPKRII